MSDKKKRVLPRWMATGAGSLGKCSKTLEDSKNTAEPSGKFINFEENTYLEFHGKIHYIYNRDECNFICQNIIAGPKMPKFCGFDIEWKVNYNAGEGLRKTALIQICLSEDECYVFHISAMIGFPIALKTLVEDEKIIKAGVGINGDMGKISLDFKMNPAGIADLSAMLNKAKKINENWSLDGMVQHMLKKRLNKDPKLRCSDWERFPLTEAQLRYSALDAYVRMEMFGLSTHEDV